MRKNRRGFSLTEMVLVMLIVSVSIAIAVEAFIATNRDYKIIMSFLNSYLKGREVIDRMSKDCRVAIRVLDAYGSYVTADDSLVLMVPSIDAGGDVIDINNDFDYIAYDLQGADLRRVVMPGGTSSRPAADGILGNNIESLDITSQGVPLSGIAHKSTITQVTLALAISETVFGREYRVTPGTTVKLMNYEWEFIR